MAIELATKYLPYVDELFSTESKSSILTNSDFDFTNANTVKIYSIGTADMHDYSRNGALPEGQWSRYGAVQELTATTQEFTLSKDRSFTFEIDKLDTDETVGQLAGASALARQLRQVIVPEVDAHTYTQMIENAGNAPAAKALTAANIYGEIIAASNALDNAEAPDANRVLMVTPNTYMILKQSKDIVMETDIGNDLRLRGIIALVDGMYVLRVPAARLPAKFGFMVAHPVATTFVQKLASYKVHADPPGINGSLVEGRVVFDAFIQANKANALYYQATA